MHILTALKPGIVTVTAQSESDMTVTAQCTVNITRQGVENITLDPAELTLKKGETAQIAATAVPENAMDNEIIWSSSRPEIASVNTEGKVTAISEGTAVITARAGTAEATATVTVVDSPSKDSDNGQISTGDNGQFIPALLAVLVSAVAAGTCLAVRKRRKHR